MLTRLFKFNGNMCGVVREVNAGVLGQRFLFGFLDDTVLGGKFGTEVV